MQYIYADVRLGMHLNSDLSEGHRGIVDQYENQMSAKMSAYMGMMNVDCRLAFGFNCLGLSCEFCSC